MNQAKWSILVGLLLVLLSACTSGPVVPPSATVNREPDAEAAVARGDFAAARDIYRALAERAEGDERSRYQIERARAEVELGAPDVALAVLGELPVPLPAGLDAEAAGVRGKALFALGRTVEAVRVLVNREIWLDSSAAILANQAEILNGLALPTSRAAAQTRTGDTTIDGWLALAPLARPTEDSTEFMAQLLAWRNEFPNHEAAAGILAERLAALRAPGLLPAQIALLLPLSDNTVLGIWAKAIRDGFVAAHFASGHANRTAIRFYDTAQRDGLENYEAAQLAGADFIVGPLLASEVGKVQAQAGFVGTLALNVSDSPAAAATNFFQYALSYDDEVEAIATRAIAAGNRTAVVLYGNDGTSFGNRIMSRFRQAFESRGGQVINSASYLVHGADLAAPIEDVLNISRSEARRDQLRRTLGRPFEFEPRRRTDIDMIFLQADDQDARLIVPLLKTFAANNIPTYATRDVYDPARDRSDTDLDGVIFPDLPLLLRPVGAAGTARTALSEFSTENAEQAERYFAFGFDAYYLAEALYSSSSASWPFEGATGELYLGSDGRIRRVLPFAEFRDGRPASADTAESLTAGR